ncbi:hypothetical protein [Bradyrhizobium sp. HKCCYLR1051]|uniref:hypothetical protein n=1 Tax=Bradyrhizobium sp. HKCCYLR1051 TaxID=3420738 RepID=UPI003EBC1DCA
MTAPICITKDEIAAGLNAGRPLIQEEWANPQEIAWVDELIAEGIAQATPFEWKPGFQCERRIVTRAAPPSANQQFVPEGK